MKPNATYVPSALIRRGIAVVAGGLLLAACGAAAPATPTAPGISATTITMGATMPLTGSAAAGGLGTSAGQDAYFKYVNDHGGVKGRKIKFIALDDQYSPSVAVTQMHVLIQEDHIFAVDGGEGTPNFLANVPYLESVGIPVVGPYSPSNTLGTMKTPNIYMIAPNYVQEFKILAKYAYAHSGAHSYSLVGVTGNVDQNALEGMQEGLRGTGSTIHNIPEVPGTSNMEPLAAQLQGYGAKWVFLIITNGDTGNLLEAMNRIGYHPRLASWSGMTEQSYYTEFGSVSQGLIAVEEQLPNTSQAPGVQSMVKLYRSLTGTAPNTFNELGWVQAALAVKALRAAKTLTWKSFEDALDNIRNFDTGILPPISFGPQNRQGANEIALAQIRGDHLEQLSGFTAS